MSDKAFEWSIKAVSIIALIWIVVGAIFRIMDIQWVIVIGLVAWIVGGGILLYFWGKNYMSRV